ncbi:MAG: hypothetical protein HQL05_03150 [Nitrospirae bacterium]|uniref:hypothetical protein n=1 Tax=Candidatus Magnetobacterium casense TaxID=1455061 RepID=UPI00058C913D|nr:hypothetical protein [Candidatus Magnetobacterium casensis]MBF0336805.1 hypothetical protein [Nitrospirota bacterium]
MKRVVLVLFVSMLLAGCAVYHDASLIDPYYKGCHYEANGSWVCGYDRGYSITADTCCDYPVAYRTKMREYEVPVYRPYTYGPYYGPYYPYYGPYYPY